jgi:hypothetical protein
MFSCGSENKQRLFPYTTLPDWFFFGCAARTGSFMLVLVFKNGFIVEAVSRQPLTADDRMRSYTSGGQLDTETSFSRVVGLSPYQFLPTVSS